ncbi:hypothetical protein DAPPUDRAFT_112186 [Daphnia pulex]|uniref:Uncharacterized protein n=1 Tax=Daphnia pulex TaxID=6669 RepID=E9HB57_DAPPU|nr:hypothetical protein DAPPUDRAFT_112186 [Daphnia pulex]|eukprot:EFX71025.1 hypothetical protein DAPPUDRAFT_112186 [Daphnia pulex]
MVVKGKTTGRGRSADPVTPSPSMRGRARTAEATEARRAELIAAAAGAPLIDSSSNSSASSSSNSSPTHPPKPSGGVRRGNSHARDTERAKIRVSGPPITELRRYQPVPATDGEGQRQSQDVQSKNYRPNRSRQQH